MIYKKLTTYEEVLSAWETLSDCFNPSLKNTLGDIEAFAKKWSENAVSISCILNERLVGCVTFYCNDKRTNIGYITELAVVNDERGKGLGWGLVREAELYSAQHGMLQIELQVRKNNHAAIEFYKRIGFEILSEQEHSLFLIKDILH